MQFNVFILLLALWLQTSYGNFDEDVIRSQVVDVRLRRTHSSGFEVKLSAFGEDFNLRLRRSVPDPSKPVFSPNFTMLMINADENGESALDITPPKQLLKASEGNVYVDPKAQAALHLSPNSDGKYQVNGFLGQGRSISSKGGVHTVTLSRYIPIVPDYEDKNRSVEAVLMQGRSWAATVVQPEVLIVVDYLNSQHFKDDTQMITDYFSIFFHSVNNRYATLSDPKISFVITGVLQMNSTSAQPFLEKNKVGTNGYDILKVLDSFSNWIFKKRKVLPKHDLVTLITGTDLYIQEPNGNYAQGVNGRAYIKGACWFDELEKKFMGSSVTEDIGGFWDGAWTLAHELGHNLGAYHDGEGEAKDCDKSVGHIMSYAGWGGESKFFFSKCSIKTMSNFLKSTGATCLKNFATKSPTRWNATSLNIGDKLNFTTQCKKQTKNKAAFVEPKRTPDELCRNLACRIPDPVREGYYTVLTLNKPAGDGSPCDVDKKCMTGKCVDKPVEEQMERDRLDLQKKIDQQARPEDETDGAVFVEKRKPTKQPTVHVKERKIDRDELSNPAEGIDNFEAIFNSTNNSESGTNNPESATNINGPEGSTNTIPEIGTYSNLAGVELSKPDVVDVTKPSLAETLKAVLTPNINLSNKTTKKRLKSESIPKTETLILGDKAEISSNRKAERKVEKAVDPNKLNSEKELQKLMELYLKES